MITLTGSTPPTDQIRDQIRGLIVTGQLAANDRLPSVRQLAKDLGIAPGTVAKAYKALEAEGFLTARTGGGTRVSSNATTTARPVLDAAHHLANTAVRTGTSLNDITRILRAIWPEQHQESATTHTIAESQNEYKAEK